jgi:hypothetical protein
MAKIVLDTITNAQNISLINSNFTKIKDALDNDVLYRDNPVGEPNALNQDLDFNSNNALNIQEADVQVLKIGGVTVVPGSVIVANALLSQNNLSDVQSAAVSRSNLGLGSVDNTSDLNKPISTATQTALNGKVNTTTVIDVAHGGTGGTDAATARTNLNAASLAGNTFTATQVITAASPAYTYNASGTSATINLNYTEVGNTYWQLQKDSSHAFNIVRWNGTGAAISSALSINSSTGTVSIPSLTVTGAVITGLTATALGSVTPGTGAFTTLNASGNTAIAATYTGSAALASASVVTITGFTEIFDRANEFNPATGVFTPAVTGIYAFSGIFTMNSAANVVGSRFLVGVQVGGVTQSTAGGTSWVTATGTSQQSCSFSGLLSLTAGQSVTFVVTQNTGAARSIDGTQSNFITINRVP